VEGGLTYTQTFDAENRLKSVAVSGQTTTFIYDGDGNLVKKIKPDNSKTIYVGGIYEVDKTSGGSVTRTVTYYPAAGAMRINSTLYFTLKDHLGSASVVTDASGNILGENRYYPYGETRLTTGTIFTDKLFTGQREMAGLGIYHYGARFYSPKLGRFLSADSIVSNPMNPQAFNRYSYVLNNPLRYIDPSGHDPVCGFDYSDPECNGPDPWVPTTPPTPPPYVPLDPGLPQDDDEPLDLGLEPEEPLDPGLEPEEPTTTPDVTLPQPPFTNPGYSVPEFVGGAILFVGGLGFAALGVSLIAIAVGEVLGGVVTGPGELLILPHAVAMVAIGGGLFVIGGVMVGVGFLAMKDAVTP
jgi:RHS repeat-associated protein